MSSRGASTGIVLLGLALGCDPAPPAPDGSPPRRTIEPRGTVVFESDRDGDTELYLLDIAGGTPRRLTRSPGADGHPAFAPDGDRIAFFSERTGGGDLYVLDLRDGSVRRLTDHPAYEGAPSWGPDGAWIAFEGERDGRSEIYRIELETGRVERLTDSGRRKLGPAVAPDGRRIALMEKGVLRWALALLEPDGALRRLASRGGSCRPAWSPDGRLLAFVSTAETTKADLWLWDAERNRSWRVPTRPNAHNYDPAFSPDGLFLAFASTVERGEDEDWDLFVADVNGRGVRRLTSGPGDDRFPDWRPRERAP